MIEAPPESVLDASALLVFLQGESGDEVLVPLTEEAAIVMATLRPATRAQSLSLGDRARLATGLQLGLPVLTADRLWTALSAGVSVQLIRR